MCNICAIYVWHHIYIRAVFVTYITRDTKACYVRHKYGSYINVMSHIYGTYTWHIYVISCICGPHICRVLVAWCYIYACLNVTFISFISFMCDWAYNVEHVLLKCYIHVCDQSSARHISCATASRHIHTCARTSRHIHTCAWTHISNAASHTRGSHFTHMSKSCHMCMCIWSQICDTYKEVWAL